MCVSSTVKQKVVEEEEFDWAGKLKKVTVEEKQEITEEQTTELKHVEVEATPTEPAQKEIVVEEVSR